MDKVFFSLIADPDIVLETQQPEILNLLRQKAFLRTKRMSSMSRRLNLLVPMTAGTAFQKLTGNCPTVIIPARHHDTCVF